MANERDYPLPAHAASVWFNGEALMVALPGHGDSRGHTIAIPIERLATCDGAAFSGWGALRALLTERYHDSQHSRPLTVGRKSAPVQYDLDAMLKAVRYDRSGSVEVSPPNFEDL